LNEVKFDKATIITPYGLVSVEYRITGDPLARIIIVETRSTEAGKDVIINKEWTGSVPVSSYKIKSYGITYISQAGKPVRAGDILDGFINKTKSLNIFPDTQLNTVIEMPYLRTAQGYRGIVSMATTRMLIPNDPLNRDIAIQSPSGEISIIKWWEKTHYDIAPGQLVYNSKIHSLRASCEDRIVRETQIDDKANWPVVSYPITKERMERLNQVSISYNLQSGVYFEDRKYLDFNLRIYYFDGFPMFAML
jgi:hypothetical protein